MSDPYISVSSDNGTLALNGIAASGAGVEARSGITGLGLPPFEAKFTTGAGDGSTFQTRRAGARTIDIPVTIAVKDRVALRAEVRNLARVVTGANLRLRWMEAGQPTLYVRAALIGGGDYVYGQDTTGEYWAKVQFTFQTEDAYWVSETPSTSTATLSGTAVRSVTSLTNAGGAPAHMTYKVTGPCNGFSILAGNSRIQYKGILQRGETVIIDTSKGSVKSPTGVNKYANLGTLPNFAPVKSGQVLLTWERGSMAYFSSLTGTALNATLEVSYYPSEWLVI